MPRAMYRDSAPVQASPPGDRRDGHPCWRSSKPPSAPPISPPIASPGPSRRCGLSPDAVPTGPTQPAPACRPCIAMSVFQSPDLAEFTGDDRTDGSATTTR